MVSFAAEAEGRRQTPLGQKLVIFANQFRKNLLSGLHDNDVRQSDDPNLRRVAVLTESLHTMGVKHFGVAGSWEREEVYFFFALFLFFSFHDIQKNPPRH